MGVAAALGAVLSGCAEETANVPAKITSIGTYTTLKGQDLFTARGNPGEVPAGGAWVPLYARVDDSSGTDFKIVNRPDGTLQWAFRGEPVYYYNGSDASRSEDPEYRTGKWKLLTYPYGRGGVTSGGH